jgi:hypothetical protein
VDPSLLLMGSQKDGTERAHSQSDRVDGSPWKDFEEAEVCPCWII